MKASVAYTGTAGDGGRHGEDSRDGRRTFRWREKLVTDAKGVGESVGRHKASGVGKTEGGDKGHAVVIVIESPVGAKNPRVEGPPRGDESCGVTLDVDIVPDGYKRGWGGDGKSPSTQEAAADNGRTEEGSNTPK